MGAPFFGYTHIAHWEAHALPDTVLTLPQLERYLDNHTKRLALPFMFRLTATAETALVHVVNLPKGTQVNSPDDAHKGLVHFMLHKKPCEVLGFFSRSHQSIFTHHNTFTDLHLITADQQMMGHLEEVQFVSGTVNLFLPMQ